MRLIGHLPDEARARTFGDFLYVQGIENNIEHDKDDGWAIWINDEDKIEPATALLAGFRQSPDDPKYRTEAKSASQLRAEEQKGQAAWQKKLRNRRHLFRPLQGYGFGPLTFALIAISAGVFILSNFGTETQPIRCLFIRDFTEAGNYVTWDSTLPEIRHGQVWRLFTPIFIHFSVLHILFNMLWLRDLGSMIEGRQSSWHLLALTLVIAAGSNLAQFYLGRPPLLGGLIDLGYGPIFGGMSGVLYGLLGYVWIRGKLDPGSGLFLHPTTVTMMIVWFVICFTPLLGLAVANVVHAVGLLMGMAWGYLSSLRYR